MAAAKRPEVREQDVQGFKDFRVIRPFLDRVHDHATQGDRAGNRRLHDDQDVVLLLLDSVNPILTRLRGVPQASTRAKVQTPLGCPRASWGSLSEARHVLDPAVRRPLLGERAEPARPVVTAKEAEALKGLTAADGGP